MSTLAETQLLFRNAIVAADTAGIGPLLTGGRDPRWRLTVHQRNYETSLVTALLTKFPASVWLAGSSFVIQAARRFVQVSPPNAPCIAEYGEAFPSFLQESAAAVRFPYVGEFARLEWHVGQVSVAIEEETVTLEAFSTIDPNALPDTTLGLQKGVRYLKAGWPVDDLLRLYLSDTAPDHYSFEPADVWIEIRGSRGEFQINRLSPADFIFRKFVSHGQSIGDAAEAAFGLDAAFDPGAALASMIGAGLAIDIKKNHQGEKS